jgi:AraC-like DNA-binding protein
VTSRQKTASVPAPIRGTSPAADAQRVGPACLIPDLLRQFGVDPADVLAEVGLPPDAIDSPEARLSYAVFTRLLAAAAERAGCEHFGLLIGRRTGLDFLGPVGELTRHSPTVGDGLRNYVVHHHLYSRAGIVFLLTEGDVTALGLSVDHPDTDGVAQHQDGALAIMLNVMRELTSPDWLPDEFLLAHRAPEDRKPYRQAFPRRLRFDAEFTGVRFASSVLQRPVPTADRNRYAVAEAQLAAIGRRSLVNDLRRALRVELMHGEASGDRVAQTLAMHRRTLNRRLKAAGTTFQALLDEVRCDAARHYLLLTRMPLVDIAAALGYSDASAFSRAFRRWTGTVPARFRQRGAGLSAVPMPAR